MYLEDLHGCSENVKEADHFQLVHSFNFHKPHHHDLHEQTSDEHDVISWNVPDGHVPRHHEHTEDVDGKKTGSSLLVSKVVKYSEPLRPGITGELVDQ